MLLRLLPLRVRLVSLTATLLAVTLAGFLAAGPASARQLGFRGTAEIGDADNLRGLVFSPDGRHAYSFGDRAGVFRVDETAGGLRFTFVQTIESPLNDWADKLRIVFHPDGRLVFLYRGYYAGIPDGFPSSYDLLVYRRDVATGRLTLLGRHDLMEPTFSVPSDGRHLYLAEYQSVRAFDVQANGLDMVWESDLEELTGAAIDTYVLDVESSPDGSFVYLLGDDGDSIGVFERERFSGDLDLRQTLRREDGASYVDRLGDLVTTADGRQLFARTSDTSATSDLLLFSRDPSDGELSLEARYSAPFDDPKELIQIAVSPDDRFLLALWKLTDQHDPGLAVYERTTPDGHLVLTETTVVTGTLPFAFFDAPKFSPSGRFLVLYSSRGTRAFAWNSETGGLGAEAALDFVDHDFALRNPRALAVHPQGDLVYAAIDAEKALGILRRQASGGLELVQTVALPVEGEIGVTALGFDASGRHLYAGVGKSLAVFEVDPQTGTPSELQTLRVAPNGDNFFAVRDLAMTEDGSLLVMSAFDGVAVFGRDPATGLLTPMGRIFDGDSGVDLRDVRSVSVSRDGRHVYAGVFNGNTVVVLDVDPVTGELTPKQTLFDVVDTVPGLAYVWDVALTSDERNLIMAGRLRIVVYERDPATGLLSLEQLIETPDVRSLEVDPEGRRVVAAQWGKLDLYLRDSATGRLTLFESLDSGEIGVEGLSTLTTFDSAYRMIYTAGWPGKIGLVELAGERPCDIAVDRLCLGDQERFEVRVDWRDFEGNTGFGRVATLRSNDSGILWFFSEDNWEMQVKVLDACTLNDRFWVFASAATTVETTLTVTDHATGEVRTYFNPLGRPASAITDTDAFSGCGAQFGSAPAESNPAESNPVSLPVEGQATSGLVAPSQRTADTTNAVEPFDCHRTPTDACLGDHRFRVEVDWRDGAGSTGAGRVVPAATDDSVMFWFFGPNNWELMVKVLDGCPINGHHWVLSAATTDVEYTLRITDSETGEVREYVNPLGTAAAALADIEAFSSCS